MMEVLKDMMERPGLYKKLWMSLAASILSVLNNSMGMALDEELYSRGAQDLFNLVILLSGSFAVYAAKNESKK
jgi:hypothetical protein